MTMGCNGSRWSTGFLSVGFSANAGMGGTGGGGDAMVGLGGGERYGIAKESDRRCPSFPLRLGERGGDEVGNERGVVGGEMSGVALDLDFDPISCLFARRLHLAFSLM